LAQFKGADMIDDRTESPSNAERFWVLACYGLFLLGICNGGFTTLIGAALVHIRRGEAPGAVWDSHYRNMSRVFWVGVVLGLLMLGLMFSGVLAALSFLFWPGWIFTLPLLGASVPLAILVWLMFAGWYLYRVLRGFVRALDDKPW
jgi:uncharacterized membrane protein